MKSWPCLCFLSSVPGGPAHRSPYGVPVSASTPTAWRYGILATTFWVIVNVGENATEARRSWTDVIGPPPGAMPGDTRPRALPPGRTDPIDVPWRAPLAAGLGAEEVASPPVGRHGDAVGHIDPALLDEHCGDGEACAVASHFPKDLLLVCKIHVNADLRPVPLRA